MITQSYHNTCMYSAISSPFTFHTFEWPPVDTHTRLDTSTQTQQTVLCFGGHSVDVQCSFHQKLFLLSPRR